METNYFGAYRMMKAVIPIMRTKGLGTIINISSQAGRRPFFLQGPYCASKYALNGLSETLAHEVAKFGIRVALVEPGVVRTPIFGKNALPDEDKEHYEMLQSRTVRMITKGLMETGCDPIDIAKCMEEIVVSENPKMHYLLEQDARDNIRVYDEDGPEAWIEDGKIEDDDEYFKIQENRYGYDLGQSSLRSSAPLLSSLPKTLILVCNEETSFIEASNFFVTASVLLSKLSN